MYIYIYIYKYICMHLSVHILLDTKIYHSSVACACRQSQRNALTACCLCAQDPEPRPQRPDYAPTQRL